MVEPGDGDEAALNTTQLARQRASFAAAPTLAPSAAGPELAVGDGARARSLELAPSARLGSYLILRELGAGGMGVVYAAYHEGLDRRVAIKLVRRSAGESSDGHARILREAQALARLSHPNVVQIYEVGEHQGQVFLAMEYVDGEPLSSWQAATGRSLSELVDAYRQAAEGLRAAHLAGLVHRDFKPLSTPSPTRTPLSQQIGCNPTKSGVLAGVAFFPEGLRAPPVAQNQAKTRQNRAAR
jgi:hypothetical protein